MSESSILLDGQFLHGVDRFGEWFVTGLEGWNEPPEARVKDVEITGAHGDYPALSTYAARTPTIDGYLLLKDRGQGLGAMSMLNARATLSGATLTVSEGGVTQSAQARLVGLDWTWETQWAIRFQLRLRCPDPRKYGGWQEPVVVGESGAAVFHRGNADSRLVATVTGTNAREGYRLRHEDGTVFEVQTGAYSNAPHTVDMATGRAYIGSSVPVSSYGRAQPLLVHPGSPQIIRVEPLGTGTVTAVVEVQDTWI